MSTAKTIGMNHLGLTVRDLSQTTTFFCDVLGWDVTAEDPNYPRNTVTDGTVRLTLWQVQVDGPAPFDRKTNLGLHHLALEVADEAALLALGETLAETDGVEIEFMPEFMGAGPRKHMMFAEPGGLRIELLWAGG
ncbi:VOC family protein [Octadecabacter sp.]|nr:VOC family protein [Octadecabacter sp.]